MKIGFRNFNTLCKKLKALSLDYVCSTEHIKCRGARYTSVSSSTFRESQRIHRLLVSHSKESLHGNNTKVVKCLSSNEGTTDKYNKCNPPWRIVFFGTDDFAVQTLDVLNKNRKAESPLVGELVVVCSTSKGRRRGKTFDIMSPVQQYAIENSLPQLIWPDVGGERCKYDVGVVDSFGHLIPDNVINMFTYGLLNIHPSLLPRWRGAAPLYHTILSGDEETGVTIIQISPQFDVGPIVMQTTITVPHRSTTIQLSKILSQLGSNMLLQVLDDLPRKIENSVVQPTNGVTLAKKIKTDMSWIDWCNYSCRFIDRLHRAISTHVTLRTLWRGKLLKLYYMVDLHVTQGFQLPLADVHPGVVKYHNKHGILCIRCLDGWVGFKSVTIERRKKMSAKDFYNGFLSRDQSLDWNNFTSVRNKHTEALNKKYGT